MHANISAVFFCFDYSLLNQSFFFRFLVYLHFRHFCPHHALDGWAKFIRFIVVFIQKLKLFSTLISVMWKIYLFQRQPNVFTAVEFLNE